MCVIDQQTVLKHVVALSSLLIKVSDSSSEFTIQFSFTLALSENQKAKAKYYKKVKLFTIHNTREKKN